MAKSTYVPPKHPRSFVMPYEEVFVNGKRVWAGNSENYAKSKAMSLVEKFDKEGKQWEYFCDGELLGAWYKDK